MTAMDSDALVLDTDKLRALAAASTPGPYDGRDYLVRAIRGDLAVPLLESRGVGWDPENDGPTVRDAFGVVVFRKGSSDAKMSQAIGREHGNVRLVAYLLNSVPAILAMSDTIERQAAENERLRAALRWALPLAERSVDDHRLERVRCGHSDIHGTYKNGVTWAGIYQSEVDQIEEARQTLKETSTEGDES